MAKINVKGIKLSYSQIKGDGENIALIMHGWGANKELMEQFFTKPLKPHCKTLIFLDFAGFGGSDEPNISFNSMDYLNLTNEFLKEINLTPNILLGHSFGGKIACLMANRMPLKALILCSSAGLKLPKSFKTKCKIALAKTCKILGIKNMRKFLASRDGANLSQVMYETFKKVVDEDFSKEISKINTKTLILWGENDNATPLQIGYKMQELILNSQFKVYQGDHFFFMKNELDFNEFLR